MGLVFSGTMLMVIIPMYHFYQTTRIDKKVKTVYNDKTTIEMEDGRTVQPVYIYLYINRHTENMLPDEDYSEYV